MGVDCMVQLPPDVRLRDVAHVAGILLGKQAEYAERKSSGMSYWSVEVEGVRTEPSSMATCADIFIDAPTFLGLQHGGHRGRHFLYHFEGEHGGPSILPSCTALNIALCVGLAKFFGGRAIFNDSRSAGRRYPKPRKTNRTNTDALWDEMERDKMAVNPITWKDCLRYEKHAAYPLRPEV